MPDHTDAGRTNLLRLVPALVMGVAFVVASLVTWRTSSALFTATTSNPGDSFGTGSVSITDNDSDVALFTVTNLKPGANGQACIRVTYTGTLAASVKLYATGLSATNDLDDHIDLVVESGTNSSGTFPTCGTFSNAVTVYNGVLSGMGSSFGTGHGTWTPSSNPTVVDYRFQYSLSASAPNGTQSSTASVTFTWEAQNT